MIPIYGILKFTSKSRVMYGNNTHGIEFIEYKQNKKYIVKTKKEYHSDRWAKINSDNSELIEIIGPTYDYNIELNVLKSIYGLSYRYPDDWKNTIISYPKCYDTIQAYTVDNISTTDRDDAISIEYNNNTITVGIHIIDLVRMFGENYMKYYEWSKQYISSAYWNEGMKGIFSDKIGSMISLTEKNTYPCLSLFLTFDNNILVNKRFEKTNVHITKNMTYNNFSDTKDANTLRSISKNDSAEDLIAWCMIQYNLYFAMQPNMILRVQESDKPAYYDYTGTHASFDNIQYTHATSPIRRFIDFHNMCVYHYPLFPKLNDMELDHINMRMNEIKEFHKRETIVSLAYMYKDTPLVVSAYIVRKEEDRYIQLMIGDKRVIVPLNDTYYADEICSMLEENNTYQLKIFGIHKDGKATLRLKLVDL